MVIGLCYHTWNEKWNSFSTCSRSSCLVWKNSSVDHSASDVVGELFHVLNRGSYARSRGVNEVAVPNIDADVPCIPTSIAKRN